MMKFVFLIDLSPGHKIKYYFNIIQKQLSLLGFKDYQFIYAKPKSLKIADYIEKRKEIESKFDLYNPKNIIICFGKTSRIFNPKYESPPFGHLKIKIYDLDTSKKSASLIPTEKYIEILTVPGIVNFITEDASYNFFDVLKWIKTIIKLDITEIYKLSILSQDDIIYLSHFDAEYINHLYLDPSKDNFNEDNLLNELPNNSFISLDLEWFPIKARKRKNSNIEWYNLDSEIVFLLTLGFRNKNNKISIYSFFYPGYRKQILNLFEKIIEEKNPIFVGVNINTDLKFIFREIPDYLNELIKSGKIFNNFKIRDIRDYIIEKDNSQVKEIGLKTLAAYYLYEFPYGIDYSIIHQIGQKSIIENKLEFNEVVQYAIRDNLSGLLLTEYFEKRINPDRKFFLEYLTRLNLLMFYMSFRGIKINIQNLKKFNKIADKVLNNLKSEFQDKFNISNPNSIKQIQTFLSKFDEAKQIFPKTLRAGLISIRVPYLLENYSKLRQKIKNEELIKFLDLFFKYKLLTHLKSTFLNIDDFADKNNFIHPDYSSHRIITGRIVSTNPCVQQLPTIKTAQRKLGGIVEFPEYVEISAIKEKILCPESDDNILIFIDFKQADIRIGQIISNDQNLYQFFSKSGYNDLFKEFFGREYNNDYERNLIKSIVLGFLYGISEYGISSTLSMMASTMNEELRKIFENPLERFKFAQYIKQRLSELFNEYNNYLKTVYFSLLKFKRIELFRNRNFNSIKNINFKIKNKDFYKFHFKRLINSAYNFGIQGLTNDVMNNFVYYTWKKSIEQNLTVYPVAIIYDECIFEVSKKDKNKFLEILKENFRWDFNRDFEQYLLNRIKKFSNIKKDLNILPMEIEIKEKV